MSNVIVTRISGKVPEVLIRPQKCGKKEIATNFVWSYKYKGGDTFLMHHFRANAGVGFKDYKVLETRDIDSFGTAGLSKEMLSFIDEECKEVVG